MTGPMTTPGCESELVDGHTKPEVLQAGCTRSHPHENMSAMCELRTELAKANFDLAVADARTVMEFGEEEVPQFTQGLASHELLSVVTAERCTELVNLIVQAKQQLATLTLDNQRLRDKLTWARNELNYLSDGGEFPSLNAILSTPADTAALDAYVSTQVEPWKKDAELYRKLRAMHWSDSPNTLCVTYAHAVKLGYDCPSEERLDKAIAAQEPKA